MIVGAFALFGTERGAIQQKCVLDYFTGDGLNIN